LLVVHGGVVYVLALGVLPFHRGRACLAVLGYYAADCHRGSAGFLAHQLNGVGIDLLQADHVGIRISGHGIVLAIEFRAHLEVDGITFSVGEVDHHLESFGYGLDG